MLCYVINFLFLGFIPELAFWILHKQPYPHWDSFLQPSTGSSQQGNHMYHISAKQHLLKYTKVKIKVKMKTANFAKEFKIIKSWMHIVPGSVLLSPNFPIVLFNKFLPRLKVFKNCSSSSLIVSMILWGSFRT